MTATSGTLLLSVGVGGGARSLGLVSLARLREVRVGVLETGVDHRSQPYLAARAAMLAALARLDTALDAAREAGGERAVTRHHARGKLLARERIELLVDRDSPLLELSPVAGWGVGGPVGAAVVTTIGVVADHACVIIAHDPTVPAGTGTLQKVQRAQQIALENGLPLVTLVDTAAPEYVAASRYAGTAPPGHEAGQVAAGIARLAAAGIPTVGAIFGLPPAGSADPRLFDHTIGLRSQAGAPPVAGPVDHLAEDERDALRLARQCAARFRPATAARPAAVVVAPKHDPEDLLGVPPTEPWEILARVLDGSEFDEVQPESGPALCAGWGALHGSPVAVLAEAGDRAGDDEARKATRLVQHATRAGVPLLILQQGSGAGAVLSGTAGAAVGVPMVTVRVGGWSAVSALPALARFRFAWPDPAGPGAAGPGAAGPGAAGPGAADGGTGPDPAEGSAGPDPAGRDGTAAGSALDRSGALDDDGIIDPRDTRTVLGLCLAVMRP